MPTIYTVELDGKTYDLEGDHPPSEAEARSAVGAYQPQATPLPEGASKGMLPQSTVQGDPVEGTAFGRPARPDLAMALSSEDVMGAPMAPPVAMMLSKAPGIIARGVAKYPKLATAAIGAAPGILQGDLKGAAIGAALGTPWSRTVQRAAKAVGGAAPRPAPKPQAMDMAKLNQAPARAPAFSNANSLEDIATEGTRRRMAAQPPASALQREVMAREPGGSVNWRTTDAVPIDAMKRDVSRGGAIIEAGESQLGLGERIATLLKAGTPEAMAEATQLAKALRQRGHIAGR